MGNALGKKMEVVMADSASLVKGKMEGHCNVCDMMLMDKDSELFTEGKFGFLAFTCPRCGSKDDPYTGKDHATRHQPKGGDPWQKK